MSTTKGSCVCGEWTYEYSGEPGGVAVCHCIPCRKTAGANGSFNLVIPQDNFHKLGGTDFLFTRQGESGKSVHYKNCGTCGTVMVADVEILPGMVLVKGGTVDDQETVERQAPKVEIYRRNAPSWCAPFSGAMLKEGGS